MTRSVPTKAASIPAALCLAGLLAGPASAQKQRDVWIDTKKASVESLAFSPDGKTLAYSVDRRNFDPPYVALCDVATGKQARKLETDRQGNMSKLLAFTPDGKSLLFATFAGGKGKGRFNTCNVEVWDVAKKVVRFDFDLEEGDGALQTLANDGKTLVVRSPGEPPVGAVYDLTTKRRCAVLLNGKTRAQALSLSDDGKWLATWHRPNFVSVWDFQKRGEVRCFEAHKEVIALAISPKGDRVVTTDGTGELLLFDAQKGKELARYRPKRTARRYHYVAFGPEGKTVIAAGDCFGTGVLVWDPATGAAAGESNEEGNGHDQFVLSPDRRTLASHLRTEGIRFWDLPSAEEVNKRKK